MQLQVDPIAAESGNALIVLQPQDEEEGEGEGDAPAPPSIYSMWLVEHVDPAQGAALMFNAKTRLRNVATGGYLCPSLRWNTLVARQLQWGTSGRGAATLQHSIASFRTLSQHQTESQAVTGMAGVWLVFPHPETPIYMPEGHTGSSHDTPPAWLRVAQPEVASPATVD
ncbi:hypothetical protein T484DRAFT_1801865 [Baffinella frigidus]|nr:hypothetical protein T484DRAFT_1801865 [Cryptophyta sp. CCMP2293]